MSNQISRIQYTADGTQTEFAYPFRLYASSNLRIYIDANQITTGWRSNF